MAELFLIEGRTNAGKPFRPSDWAERLAGVLSAFRPGYSASGKTKPGQSSAGYSPYAQPVIVAGLKCVVVDTRIKELEPMAWEFICGFASDNDLPMVAACLLEEGYGPSTDSKTSQSQQKASQ
jgi:hypothetical protein